jgi:hypothetical protein
MIALKMIEILEAVGSSGAKPVAWRMRHKTLYELRRESRHTGDVRTMEGRITFLAVPIEVADVRNSLGAELVTNVDNAAA